MQLSFVNREEGQLPPGTENTQRRVVRKTRLEDQGGETDLSSSTPEERLGMMWQLTLDAWAFTGEPVAEQGLPRHIVRVLRSGR